MRYQLHRGDNLAVLRAMPDNSVDAVVTDPPYGLSKEPDMAEVLRHWLAGDDYKHRSGGFMGKSWDAFVPGPSVWRECLRVLKPGGHLLAFFGTRTQDMGTLAIRLAGFEIRDSIAWVYGSGFPKSHNGAWGGTALKPAVEPITMARKPLEGTVAANHAKHGTGALNIDACRVHSHDSAGYAYTVQRMAAGADQNKTGKTHQDGVEFEGHTKDGRWPANLIHDGSDEVLAAFPSARGQLANASTSTAPRNGQHIYGELRRGRGDEPSADSANTGVVGFKVRPGMRRLDEGSATRFFYCAKASKTDRGAGNIHPTVKPTELMAYLCRLVTPPDGVVLDPFMGSGSTGKACMREGFRFIGIDLDDDGQGNPLGYIDIARARIEAVAPQPASAPPTHEPQGDLFLN